MRRTILISSTMVVLLMCCKSADAARLIGVEFEHEGQPVLTTYYADDGYPPPADIWQYLGTPPNMNEDKNLAITPLADDPLKARLEGEVVIGIKNARARGVFQGLSLVRDDATKDHWYLPADEVARTAKIVGLPSSPTPTATNPLPAPTSSIPLSTMLVGGVIIAVVLALIVVVATTTKRRDT